VVQPDVSAARMILFHRLPGNEQFVATKMQRSPKGWWNGAIPASAVNGKTLHYYIEAQNGTGKPTANNGRNDSPNLMIIREGAPRVAAETYALLQAARDHDEAGASDENPLEALEAEQARQAREATIYQRAPGAIWAGLGFGSSFGWHPTSDLEFHKDKNVTSASASGGLFHIVPSVGYQMTEEKAVSIEARIQYVPESGSGDSQLGTPEKWGITVLARMLRFHGDGNLRYFTNVALGYGEGFRLIVKPIPAAALNRGDTVRGGPVVGGGGGGVLYHVSRGLAVTVGATALAGLPDFAVVVDFAAGAQISF
jgi:hypothetical protein